MGLTERETLPHDVPLWIDPQKEVYFLTINCAQRGTNQLASEKMAQALFESIAFRQQQRLWFAYVVLIMPDHVHGLFSFPPSGRKVQGVVSDWKRWTGRNLRIEWQRDFFEHRLRRDENAREKADYILANPVRAKLVSRPEDWPYVWFGGAALRTDRG